ncbi:MAG: DUF512 domain-containing protein [Candidatus Cloacimonetes bacterium]|nr:DUF512 domain-containing protein [Candidatus Cloacimonadota bacterium]
MPLKIASVTPASPAAEAGLRNDDIILKINENPINDFLDFQYHAADEKLDIIVSRQGKTQRIILIQAWDKPLGIEPAAHYCSTCTNNCIFCFVHQMRPGLRKSLYIKDDDYRLSFVFGNYITLTNLKAEDYQRIIRQHLSPLFISVHTTDPLLHKKMLRYSGDFAIKEKLLYLSYNGISFHTQIVVVPGWNDSDNLKRTLYDLTCGDLQTLSVGIVPVGLTRYRKSLTPLQPVTSSSAADIISLSRKFPLTYCSDEIFLLAGSEIPGSSYYADYPQLENGIGMTRLLLNNWKRNKKKFILEFGKLKQNMLMVCGEIIFPYINRIALEITRESCFQVRSQQIRNDYFGSQVTVTGLLTMKDISNQIQPLQNEIVVLSGGIFNEEGLTLDNVAKKKVKDILNRDLLIIDEEFSEWELYPI